MAETMHYKAVIIGAGQAGNPLSTTLANAGWKTALIEKRHVGGTCVNYGCTPTKTMVASARVAYLARRGADYGVLTGPISMDMKKVRQRKRDIVESFRGGSTRRIQSTENVDLIFGEASFTGPKALRVAVHEGARTLELTADYVFINAGTRAFLPKVEGIESVATLNNETIMELDAVPEHLLVLGGGYIGLEFGQMFRRFGSRVTVVQHGQQLLGREDADVAEEVAKLLREDGIEVLLDTHPLRVRKSAAGIEMDVRTPQGERTLAASHLLVATGRLPNSEALHLAAAGVQVDRRGFIPTNDRCETNVPGIYALGDIKGGPAFTHISYDDFRIIRANLLEGGNGSSRRRLVPYTAFIDPQLARVGLSEQEAREQRLNIKVARMPMSHVARALEVDETRGFMKAIVDAETGQILGATVLGIEGGELMAVFQMAMMGGVPYQKLRDAVFSHPTLAESLNNLFAALNYFPSQKG
jgi:pyruvate/2-oxoglutarate dehydrogenase complex dihydrolipoamide dehydrogenase (E3) component